MTAITHQPLVDAQNCYFFPPPPGKPAPSAHYDGKTTRIRIIQEARKAHDCAYGVMQWLKPSIGENFILKFSVEKDIENLFLCRQITSNKMHAFLEEINTIDLTIPIGIENLSEESKSCLADFVKQEEMTDLADFADSFYTTVRYESNLFFIFRIFYPTTTTPSDEELEAFSRYLYDNSPLCNQTRDWDALSFADKNKFLESIITRLSAYSLQLKTARWNVHRNITDLISEMRERGPLMVQGRFGQLYYREIPHRVNQIANRSIFAWTPNSPRQEMGADQFHTVLLVGARKDSQTETVYFVDALDPSNPSNPDSPPVYAMPYADLQKEIATVEGIKIEPSRVAPDADYFAWYGPFRNYI